MKTVFVTGVFDLLHIEHIRFLQAASANGRLIVGIESDARVHAQKGPHRPIFSQSQRLEIVKNLKMVDEAFILPENFDHETAYLNLLKSLKPDIYAVSQNSPHLENKRKICQKAGVQFKIVYTGNPEVSTSKIIEKIKQNC